MKITKRAVRLVYNSFIDCLGLTAYPKLLPYEDPNDDHCGYYSRDDNLIGINISLHDSMPDLVDSIGHEISHFLTRTEPNPHGPKWKAKAKELGAAPKATRSRAPHKAHRLK